MLSTLIMKEEYKKLFNNKFMYVAVIAIILIPTLYNLLFLNSMWDPYENLKNLPVAIVNKDEEVVYEGEKINIGEEFAKEIVKNDSMNFNLTTEEEADEGIKNGKYFMKITVPSDFSKNATSVLDTDRKNMNLIYETSQGHNYTASKMSKSAFNEIKTTLENKITKTYMGKVVDKFKDISENLDTASNGANDISDGSRKLYDGSISLVNGTKTLKNGLSKLEDGSAKLEKGMTEYTKGVDSLSGGAK